jgi:tetratricopeptide (TPR) repeat protein
MIELMMFVLTSVAAGVLGNRSDALLCDVARSLYERLRQIGPPVNRDLQRAIRKALLQATLVLLSDALRERGVDVRNLLSRSLRHFSLFRPKDQEVRWLLRAYDALAAELGRVWDAEYVPPSSVAESVAKRELAFLLEPQGVAAEERGRELRERLPEEWLKELKEKDKEKFGEPPEVFIRRLREGWKPPEGEGTVSWFDLVCAFFAHEVKHNQAVANILTAKLLAGLKAEGQPLGDAFIDYLQKQFAPVLERLEAVQRQLEELGRQQREGFEELKARQAELTAILMPMRETQQVMQALLSEVVRWLRWMAENFGKSHVATYLDDATRQFLQEKWQQGFVGRKEAMERLNRFIAANPNGVAIVYAPAGYGKTTFLAHWIRQVEEAGGWLPGDGETRVAIVRHFFSPTMHLSPSPSHAFAHLLAQLTRLSDQPIPIPDRDDERWSALRNFLADLKLPEGVKLVIVLDGLDDAEGEVEPFIPSQIPEGLFAVVSGRWDGEGELPNYLKEWAKFTEFIPLKALSEEELREWLRTAGEGELAQFAENDDFVRMLREKTDGLPLFVRYLMDDLLQAVKEGRSPEQVLERTPKGFSEYVKEQFKQLVGLVRKEEGIRNLFALLTVAKGALRQDEAEELTGLSTWDFEDLPHPVTRWFSIGRDEEQRTYAFAHPLLAEEFRRHLGREAERMEAKLLQWCAGWPARPSPYILRHYADHLHEKGDPALFRLALDPAFAEAQARHLPDEPHLPLRAVRLALEMAIRSEDAPRMAALLIEHARRAGGEETPLQAWRRGHRERALRMATEILFERDPRLGTLWSLLLAWAAESEGEGEWARRILEAARKRWEGAKLEKLKDWQGVLAAFWLGELGAVEGAAEAAGLMLDDAHKGEVAAGWASRGLFDRALNVAEGIQEARERAEALGAIAEAMARTGMIQQAQEAFHQALRTAEAIERARGRAWALMAIAEAMARAGMWEQALRTAEAIEEETLMRAWALRAIAEAMARAGMWEQALRTAEAIEEETLMRAWALRAIAEAMARAGMWEQALRTAEAIKGAWERARALGVIAEAMASAGMTQQAQEAFHQALRTAEAIEWAWERASALMAIAEAMASAGMTQQAQEAFHQALQTAKAIEGARERAEALGAIAKAMARAGMTQRAQEAFHQALQTAEAIKGAWERASALRAIAEAMARAGMWEQALRTAEAIEEETLMRAWALRAIAEAMARAGMWEQALRTAEAIKGAWERARALGVIAEAMASAGMTQQALWEQALRTAEAIEWARERADALGVIVEAMASAGMWEQALRTAEAIEEPREWAEALRAIAEAMASAGMTQQAQEAFHQALQTAEAIERARERAEALRAIAEAMASAGMTQQAQEAFHQALQTAEAIKGAWERASALMAIAEAMARAGMTQQAQEAFHQALRTAEAIKGAWERAWALGAIAEAMASAGMTQQAQEAFHQALRTAEAIEEARERAEALRAIAKAMARAGMWEQALRTAEAIKEAGERAEALRAIAKAMASAEMWEQALRTAEAIKEAGERAEALRAIAKAMASAEMWEQALRTAEAIKEAGERAEALRAIAEAMARAGMWEQALRTAEAIKGAWERAEALRAIAEAMARTGMWEQALRTAEAIEWAWKRAEALRAIAEAMARAGMWEQALRTAEAIEWARERAEALRAIAEAMARAGMWEQALRTAEAIKGARERAEALMAIAEAMASARMTQQALWEQALRTAEAIEEALERAWALGAIAEAMASAGMTQQAQEAFHQALQTAEAIEEALERAEALGAIAEAMASAGMTQQAQEAFHQALQTAKAIEGARERAEALRAIAEAMARTGMTQRAQEAFHQALQTAEAIEWARERAEALGAIAETMARTGEAEGAAGIMEREIGTREQELLVVLQALTERAREGDEKSKRGFLRLLPLCGWSLELAYSACGLLARLYPQQAEGIALAVRGMPPAA